MSQSEFLEDVRVQILQAQPGDTVVLSFPGPLSPEQASRVKDAGQRFFGVANIVVLDSGGHVDSIVRSE